MQTYTDRIALLRKYETYCFQISYYMLENEDLAAETVAEAFVWMYQQDALFSMKEEDRLAYIKTCMIRQSLQIYGQSLHRKECQYVS